MTVKHEEALATRKVGGMDEEFEQLSLLNGMEELPAEALEIIEMSEDGLVLRANKEIFQPPIPSDVLKNRSLLIDNVMTAAPFESVESLEPLESATSISTRFSLSYHIDDPKLSNLTHFDREVLDAVTTLAQTTSVMTPASIYRTITGKKQDVSVSKADKEKVSNSMRKCRSFYINMDITEEMRQKFHIPEDETLKYDESLLAYAEIQHETPSGVNISYHIKSVPIIYKFAHLWGKLSVIPLALLDTPINKTDTVLAVQSFLLRAIEDAKKTNLEPLELSWEDIYEYANVPKGQRTQRQRIRENTSKMLEYWMEQHYIINYQLLVKVAGSRESNLIINHLFSE